MMLSNILHTFDIEPPKDANGDDIKISVEMTESLVSYVSIIPSESPTLVASAALLCSHLRQPKPFHCVIKPRSVAAEVLIRESCANLAEEATE